MKSIFIFALTLAMLPSIVGANTDLGPGIISATQLPYNAVRNPASCVNSADDAGPGITAALAAASAAGGGIVFLPAGRYCVLTNLTIPASVSLKGVFQGPPATGDTYSPMGGTILLSVAGTGNPAGQAFVTLSGNNSTIDGLAIFYPNQVIPTGASFVPTTYPFAIKTVAPDCVIQNILLVNPYQGIYLYNSGRHFVKGIYGQPLGVGITVDGSYDVGRIMDVHFWPFWTQNTAVQSWTKSQAFAFAFQKSDWQVVQDVFTFGYHVGMLFSASALGATNGQFSNIAFDGGDVGLALYETQPYGLQFTNFNFAGVSTTNAYGIYGFPGNSTVTVQNASFWGPDLRQSVLWYSSGSIAISGARFLNMTTGTPAVSIYSGKAMIQGNIFPTTPATGIGISIAAGAGKTMISNNMMLGKTISVSNGLNTLQSGNQP